MKLWGVPTTKHVLVLLQKACRTCFLPGRFGMAGLKMHCLANEFYLPTSYTILTTLLWEGPCNASTRRVLSYKRREELLHVLLLFHNGVAHKITNRMILEWGLNQLCTYIYTNVQLLLCCCCYYDKCLITWNCTSYYHNNKHKPFMPYNYFIIDHT